MSEIIIWKPNVTVAAVVEQNNKFLLIEEKPVDSSIVLNQPAGHLDPDESIVAGAIRETFEETAYTFVPKFLVGIYQWRAASNNITYLRFAFAGQVTDHDPSHALDEGIIRAVWLSFDEIKQSVSRHRSPLVMQCVQDYLAGKRYPLDLLTTYA